MKNFLTVINGIVSDISICLDYIDEGFDDDREQQNRPENEVDEEGINSASNSKSPNEMNPEESVECQKRNESAKDIIFQKCDDEEGSLLDQNGRN